MRLGSRASNPKVAGSIPGCAKWHCVLGQGTSPYLPRGECPCTYCKSLWIRASAKWLNVNDSGRLFWPMRQQPEARCCDLITEHWRGGLGGASHHIKLTFGQLGFLDVSTMRSEPIFSLRQNEISSVTYSVYMKLKLDSCCCCGGILFPKFWSYSTSKLNFFKVQKQDRNLSMFGCQ